ncbi:UPF0316 protein [Dirofilaria immitis]
MEVDWLRQLHPSITSNLTVVRWGATYWGLRTKVKGVNPPYISPKTDNEFAKCRQSERQKIGRGTKSDAREMTWDKWRTGYKKVNLAGKGEQGPVSNRYHRHSSGHSHRNSFIVRNDSYHCSAYCIRYMHHVLQNASSAVPLIRYIYGKITSQIRFYGKTPDPTMYRIY